MSLYLQFGMAFFCLNTPLVNQAPQCPKGQSSRRHDRNLCVKAMAHVGTTSKFPEGPLVSSKEVLNDPFLPPESHPQEVLGPSGTTCWCDR